VNRFTPQVRGAIRGAHAVADEFVGTEHLLITLARSPGAASGLLSSIGLTAERLRTVIPPGAGAATGTIPFSPGAKQAIELAAEEATAHGAENVGTVHLLAGLLTAEANAASKAVGDAGFDQGQVRQALDEYLSSGAEEGGS